MTKNYEVQTVNHSVLVSITCDRCNKTIEVDPMFGPVKGGTIEPNFGYGSRFDFVDSPRIFDICDDCAEDFFNQWIRFGRTEETE